MKTLILLSLTVLLPVAIKAQGSGSLTGRLIDGNTKQPLPAVTLLVKERFTSIITKEDGTFTFSNLAPGKITLQASSVGYKAAEIPVTIDGATELPDIALNPDHKIGTEVVVSASRRPEKITQAPASIHVIDAKAIQQFPGSNIGEMVSQVQGVEFGRSGVDEIMFNVRGFNNAFNNKVLQLIDGRIAMAALSGGLPVNNKSSLIKDDIDKLEMVLGPQSALYGPNALNAVFSYTTKDPRIYQGSSVSVTAGNQHQFSVRFREGIKLNKHWAFKLTGEYATGREYRFYDSIYLNPIAASPAIPERNVDFNFHHKRAETHLYYTLNSKTDIIVSGGISNSDFLQVTTGGRNQMQGFTYSFLQARITNPSYFVNVYNTWGNIGNSYPIFNYTREYWRQTNPPIGLHPQEADSIALARTRFKEKSQRFNAEAQFNHSFQREGLFVIAGVNYQKENPNSFGIALVDKFRRIHVTQYSAVVQLEKNLPWDLRFVSALRYDHHSNFGGFYSPKLALVKNILSSSVRLSWGRAYAMPSILNQYANLGGQIFGNGAGIQYIPNGPGFSTASLYTTSALLPEQISTWEIGFKGKVIENLNIDISYYNGASKNFISAPRVVRGRAIAVDGFPVEPAIPGMVVDDTLKNASFLAYFNYSDVRAYGIDLGLTYNFNQYLKLAVRYSWFGSDITKNDLKNDANNDGFISAEETSLNAPSHRITGIFNLQDIIKKKAYLNIVVRWIQSYDFYSGNQIGTASGKGRRGVVDGGINPVTNEPRIYLKNFDYGPLGGFTSVDLTAGYKLSENLKLGIGITNLFNVHQLEFVGSPSISRLISAELSLQLPGGKKIR